MGGHLTDLSRGGFLLSPYDELTVTEGSRAILQLGHRKLECEILGFSRGGVHCRFDGTLELDEYERLLTAVQPANRPLDLPSVLGHAGQGGFEPKRVVSQVLEKLAKTGRAECASVIEVSPAGVQQEVLFSIPPCGRPPQCPCADNRCWVGASGIGDLAAFTLTSEDGHFLCLRRSSGSTNLSVLLWRPLAEPPFNEAEQDRIGRKADDLWSLLSASHHFLRQSEQIHVLYGLFESLSVPLFVVDPTLRVHDANPAAGELLGRDDGIALKGGKLACASASDNGHLRRLLSGPALARTRGVSIERKRSSHPYLATALPASRSNGSRPLFLLAIRDLGTGQPSTTEIDGQAFGLTKAEGRLAQLLVRGHNLTSAAATLGISMNTARTHMKHIYEKTATSRQSQLVQLLSRSAPAF